MIVLSMIQFFKNILLLELAFSFLFLVVVIDFMNLLRHLEYQRRMNSCASTECGNIFDSIL